MRTDRDTKRASWEWPDALWHRMAPLIPPKQGQTGPPPHRRSSTYDRGELLCPADREPLARRSTRALRPPQCGLLLLCPVGHSWGLCPAVG